MTDPTILVWGFRHEVASWENELVSWFELFGWRVVRTGRVYGDWLSERDRTIELAQEHRASAFLAMSVSWIGGPPLPILDAYREHGLVTATVSHDEPYRYDGFDDRAKRQAPGYDLWFTTWDDPEYLEKHAAGRVVYAPCAARRYFTPRDSARDVRIGFVGTYYENRDPYLRAVVDMGLKTWMIPRTEPPFHRWPPPPDLLSCNDLSQGYGAPENVADACRRCVLSLDTAEHPDGRVASTKNRLFETAAAGSLTLSLRSRQTASLFDDGEHVVLYDDPADLRKKAAHYLEATDERTRIERAGSLHGLCSHTWMHRCQRFSREIHEEAAGRTGPPTQPSVGVVVPTKDRPVELGRALASIGPVPTVVVNAGGPLPRYDLLPMTPRVIPLPGANASAARNFGVDHLPETTKMVKFLDDDDMLRVGWHRTLANEDAEIVVGPAISADTRDPGFVPPERTYTSMIAVDRSAFERAGGFDESVEVAEERELLARMRAYQCRETRLDRPVCWKGGKGHPLGEKATRRRTIY